jgi:copper(I)-binding protein
MLMGLARRLLRGEHVSLSLVFEDGSHKLLDVEVKPIND